ncbi:MAG: thioredoxin [Firmicutes bacterium]|nr:thioredoxin [Bacillota bacterium]
MNITNVTSATFKTEVLDSDKPVLVDFWATWCQPCMMQAPILEKLAASEPGIKICKVNVDEEQMLAFEYKISSIPTMILFKNGSAVKQIVGLHSEEQLKNEI